MAESEPRLNPDQVLKRLRSLHAISAYPQGQALVCGPVTREKVGALLEGRTQIEQIDAAELMLPGIVYSSGKAYFEEQEPGTT